MLHDWIATHNVIGWVTGIAGSLGLVGLILLAIFAPPAFALVWKAITGFVSWFWSTRIGVGVMVAAAMFYGASWYQHRVDGQRCQAEKGAMVDAAKAKAKKRDNAIDASTTIYVNGQLKQEAQASTLDAIKESAYVKTLTKDRACPVGDDVDRLRDLAGLPPVARPQGGNHPAMPAAKTGAHHAGH